ncbi:MAG: extracellular solute-binding protein [Phycisphaeraceae bacterium]|nr:extracellular solute-binding protein [Phycisphaeraceae bacterium]
MLARILVILAFLGIVGTPIAVRFGAKNAPDDRKDAARLIVVTPHVQQIMMEFDRLFDEWHTEKYGQRARIETRRPGGTSEILKILEAQFVAAGRAGKIRIGEDGFPVVERGAIDFDVMFGGGSYDHGRLKSGVKVRVGGGEDVMVPISEPVGFGQARLDEWFGENRIGSGFLYDPEQYWIGTALSSFGIVYNREVLARLGVPEPQSFEDLCDPRLAGWIALSDPRQSGSMTTSLDAILNYYGWERGWRVLMAMSANARSFTNMSTKPPIDVAQGEAAAGLAIDFYGRSQAQAVMRPGETSETSRVGFSDPAGAVYIDADPASVMRGGPQPEMARRFIEFCLTEEAQALWQFHATGSAAGRTNPAGWNGEPMGPRQYELRRMPVRRVMYERHIDSFVDRVTPFESASSVEARGWRTAIPVMMGAFGIDSSREQREAWRAISRAKSEGSKVASETIAEMERLFFAMPDHEMPDGSVLAFSPEQYRAIRESWRDPNHPGWLQRSELSYRRQFVANYRRVVELGSSGRMGGGR